MLKLYGGHTKILDMIHLLATATFFLHRNIITALLTVYPLILLQMCGQPFQRDMVNRLTNISGIRPLYFRAQPNKEESILLAEPQESILSKPLFLLQMQTTSKLSDLTSNKSYYEEIR